MINWNSFLSKFNVILTYDDFIVDNKKSLIEQIDNLKEDLLQIQIKENLLLDVGWYPSFNINGEFQIKLIKNNNWDIPIKQLHTNDINTLTEMLVEILNNPSTASAARVQDV